MLPCITDEERARERAIYGSPVGHAVNRVAETAGALLGALVALNSEYPDDAALRSATADALRAAGFDPTDHGPRGMMMYTDTTFAVSDEFRAWEHLLNLCVSTLPGTASEEPRARSSTRRKRRKRARSAA